MAQSIPSGVDVSDRNFGVFINSNQSSFLSTQKSKVTIPFNGNLSDHDPTKSVQISLTSMLFTNTIYNITEENNDMKVLIYYAAGRGLQESYEEIDVVIPVGFYNITQLSNYLSQSGVLGVEIVQQLFQYGNIQSFVNIYKGFGAIPQDPNDPIITKAAPTNDSNTKIVLQSADLAHMIQFGTDLTSATLNQLDHSYIYAGIYVECDLEDTRFSPLLKMLGFFNIQTAPPPEIELSFQFGEKRRGYGMSFEAFQAKSGGQPYDNTVFYQVKETNLVASKINYNDPQTFYGLIVTNNTVVLTCAYELEGGQVQLLDNGSYISGASITVPSPYIVGYQDAFFGITLTVGSTVFNVVLISGILAVGMAIGSSYDLNTLAPDDPAFAADCNYATGTIPGPGLENSHCYYIATLDPGGLSGTLNQDWAGATTASASGLGTIYVLTTAQLATPGQLTENMLASPASISGISGVLTPKNVTNLSGVDEIHVHCTQLNTRNLSSSYFQPLAPADVIAVVPVEVEFGFKQNYQPPNPLTSFLNNTNISALDINLTDAKGADLDFHGVDWSITLFVTETDAAPADALTKSGNFNTPFQDQLATMEGTAGAQQKRMRQDLTFYDGRKGRRY